MLIFTATILCLTYVLTKKLYGVDAGLFAALFLSYVLIFLEKTIEVRPDLPAAAFWLASVIFMVNGIQDSRETASLMWYALSGLSMGTAIMFTQKTLFGLGGIFVALIYPFADRRMGISWKQNLRRMSAFAGALIVLIILTCGFFLIHKGLWQFINCNFIMNFHWKAGFTPYGYIKQMLRQNPFFPVIGIMGLLVATVWIYKREEVAKGSFVPVFCAYSLLAGLFIMPVPYRQYYQLFLPFLAMYSGIIFKEIMEFDIRRLIPIKLFEKKLSSLWKRLERKGSRGVRPLEQKGENGGVRPRYTKNHPFSYGLRMLALIVVIVGLVYTLRYSKPSLPNFKDLLNTRKLTSGILYLILWIPLIVSALVTFICNKRAYAVLLISIGIIAHPLDQMVTQLSEKNDGQLANIKYVMDSTSPWDAVLDGWSGYGFLRPHAYYYFFLHGEIRAMLSEKELSDDLIESVKQNNTKIVIYDGDLRALPQRTQEYISANYVPSGQDDIYVRRSQ